MPRNIDDFPAASRGIYFTSVPFWNALAICSFLHVSTIAVHLAETKLSIIMYKTCKVQKYNICLELHVFKTVNNSHAHFQQHHTGTRSIEYIYSVVISSWSIGYSALCPPEDIAIYPDPDPDADPELYENKKCKEFTEAVNCGVCREFQRLYMVITSPPPGNVSVSLSVCVSVRSCISTATRLNFTLAWSSSDGNTIRYVFPVL